MIHFRTSSTPETTIEIWDGDTIAATIHAQRAGIHVALEAGYQPADVDLDVHRRHVTIPIARAEQRRQLPSAHDNDQDPDAAESHRS